MMESRPKRKERRPHSDVRPRRWPLVLLALLATGLLVAGGISVYRGQPQMTEHEQLATIGQTLIGQQIAEGYRAAFSPQAETTVEAAGNGKYRIQGWVDLIGADGTVERQNFSCVIYKNTWGDWVGEDINLIQQQM